MVDSNQYISIFLSTGAFSLVSQKPPVRSTTLRDAESSTRGKYATCSSNLTRFLISAVFQLCILFTWLAWLLAQWKNKEIASKKSKLLATATNSLHRLGFKWWSKTSLLYKTLKLDLWAQSNCLPIASWNKFVGVVVTKLISPMPALWKLPFKHASAALNMERLQTDLGLKNLSYVSRSLRPNVEEDKIWQINA